MSASRGLLPALLAFGLFTLAPSCAMHQGTPVATTEAAPGVVTISDSNVAAVLRAVNRMEIEPSRLALERAQDPRVRDFARQMIDAHEQADQRLRRLLVRRAIVPTHNPLSYQITANLDPTLAELRSAPASEFDMAYVLQQINAHQLALHSLDSTLIGVTSDDELRAFISQEIRPSIARHYEEIKRIHASMMASPGT